MGRNHQKRRRLSHKKLYLQASMPWYSKSSLSRRVLKYIMSIVSQPMPCFHAVLKCVLGTYLCSAGLRVWPKEAWKSETSATAGWSNQLCRHSACQVMEDISRWCWCWCWGGTVCKHWTNLIRMKSCVRVWCLGLCIDILKLVSWIAGVVWGCGLFVKHIVFHYSSSTVVVDLVAWVIGWFQLIHKQMVMMLVLSASLGATESFVLKYCTVRTSFLEHLNLEGLVSVWCLACYVETTLPLFYVSASLGRVPSKSSQYSACRTALWPFAHSEHHAPPLHVFILNDWWRVTIVVVS